MASATRASRLCRKHTLPSRVVDDDRSLPGVAYGNDAVDGEYAEFCEPANQRDSPGCRLGEVEHVQVHPACTAGVLQRGLPSSSSTMSTSIWVSRVSRISLPKIQSTPVGAS